MPIAFFDLDRTLLDVNSATLWVRHEFRNGAISRRQLGLAGWWLALYRLGLTRVEAGLEAAIATLKGKEEALLERATEAFWEREVRHRVRPGARPVVARHRQQGHHTALLTSSTPYVGRHAASLLDLDTCIGTCPEVVDGAFTGRVAGRFCFGAGKLALAEEYAAARGERLQECWFYTDSRADLPVLEAVGHPVCVDPDPLLAREARRRGWPVEDWGRSG